MASRAREENVRGRRDAGQKRNIRPSRGLAQRSGVPRSDRELRARGERIGKVLRSSERPRPNRRLRDGGSHRLERVQRRGRAQGHLENVETARNERSSKRRRLPRIIDHQYRNDRHTRENVENADHCPIIMPERPPGREPRRCGTTRLPALRSAVRRFHTGVGAHLHGTYMAQRDSRGIRAYDWGATRARVPGGGKTVSFHLRRAKLADAPAAGDICYRAFKSIAEAHNFPPDFPSPEVTSGLLTGLLQHAGVYGIVAESDGRIIGSNFLDERNPISGVGPVTVDPAIQNDGVGRALMQALMRRSEERGFAGIRLVQAGYHNRSLALYLKLGFQPREQLACVQGRAIGRPLPGHSVRRADARDLDACKDVSVRVHGHDRGGELSDAIAQGTARVVERSGRVTGYATSIGFSGHAVAETNDDLASLISSAESIFGPGFLVPTRNAPLLRWCLAEGLRITQTMTLMTIGLYNQPEGAWLPSVIY